MHVVCEVDCNEASCGGGVDRDAVSRVVKELGSGVSLDVMRVEIAPPQLDIDPILVGSSPVVLLLVLVEQARLAGLPLE